MTNEDFQKICEAITAISPFIRFVGVVSESGELLANKRRHELEGIVITKTMDWGRTCIRITKTSDQDIIPILEGESYMGFNDFMISTLANYAHKSDKWAYG